MPIDEASEQRNISRILVVVDSCAQNLLALESAAALAELAHAELSALFIEDLNLIHLAGLPFASEVDRRSGSTRPLDSLQMARALRGQAEYARRELLRIAKQRQIATSLTVVRGHYMAEALAASLSMDVSFLCSAGRARLVGPAAAQAASLAANRQIDASRPVWVFYDGSPGAARALALAKQLTAPEEKDLIVLLPPLVEVTLKSLQREAIMALADRGPGARCRYLHGNDASDLARAMGREGASLLIIERENSLLAERDAQRVLDIVDCPVALVS